MKIGFIGYNKNIKRIIDQINKSRNLSLSGIYSLENDQNKSVTLNQQEITSQSDIIYISEEETEFSLCRHALKASKHLFFESPFIFSISEFRELFELAKESDSLIHFNQYFLNQPIHKKIAKLSPGIMNCQISSPTEKNEKKEQKHYIFQLISIIQNIKKTGIRKISAHPDSDKKDQYMLLLIQFDNGLAVSTVINSICKENEFRIQALQQNQHHKIDLLKHEIITHQLKVKQNQTEINKQQFKSKENLFFEEIKHFLTLISSKDEKPVTIKEKSEEIMELTHKVMEAIES